MISARVHLSRLNVIRTARTFQFWHFFLVVSCCVISCFFVSLYPTRQPRKNRSNCTKSAACQSPRRRNCWGLFLCFIISFSKARYHCHFSPCIFQYIYWKYIYSTLAIQPAVKTIKVYWQEYNVHFTKEGFALRGKLAKSGHFGESTKHALTHAQFSYVHANGHSPTYIHTGIDRPFTFDGPLPVKRVKSCSVDLITRVVKYLITRCACTLSCF